MRINIVHKYLTIYIALIFFTLPILKGFFQPGLMETYDSSYRLTRAAKFYLAIKQGQFFPRWIGDVDRGVGSPIFIYLYPLPYYIITALHIARFSLIDSLKISWSIFYLLSGIAMFWFLRNFLTQKSAFLGAIFYMWNPYRFVQLYVRGTYEETIAYGFIPLIFLAVLKIFQGKELAWFWGGLSFGLLLLTHSSITLMFIPGLLLCVLILAMQKDHDFIKKCFLLIILGLALSALTSLPNFFERDLVQIQYRLGKGDLYLTNLVSWWRLIYSPWERQPLPPQLLGFAQLAVMIISVLIIIKSWLLSKSPKFSSIKNLFFISACIWILVALILMIDTPLSRLIWKNVGALHFIYVPYLLLQLIVFWVSVLAAITVSVFKSQKIYLALLAGVVVGNLIYIRPDYSFNIKDPDLYSFDGSLSQFYEFYPATATKGDRRFKKYPLVRASLRSTIISVSEKKYNHIALKVDAKKNELLTFQQLYFPGWKAYLDDREIPISFKKESVEMRLDRPPETDQGLMVVSIPPGLHNLKLEYHATLWRILGEIVSLATVLFMVCFAIFITKLRR